jgi:hypothetical protein
VTHGVIAFLLAAILSLEILIGTTNSGISDQHLHMEHISPDFLDRGFLASNMEASVPRAPNG